MNATTELHRLGQSLWLDNINRDLLESGTLARYIADSSVTGLTSNPTIFDQAIRNTKAYDEAIHRKMATGSSTEALFFELALEDLRQAAALFSPVHEATGGEDGWVSLEVSPLLADDTASTIEEASRLHTLAKCPNLFIKIPGTAAGIPAIEASIFAGVPVNVTLLFSREQYLAAAHAYARGIQRRLAAGLDPKVGSVASIFISRWDKAVADTVADPLKNKLGVAIAGQVYRAYRDWLAEPAWRELAKAGALPQRLLWASTGTKDPSLPATYYVEALAAPDTIDTMPETTLLAVATLGRLSRFMPEDGVAAESALAQFAQSGIDTVALASQLQVEGTQSFRKSWKDLMTIIEAKTQQLRVSSNTSGNTEP